MENQVKSDGKSTSYYEIEIPKEFFTIGEKGQAKLEVKDIIRFVLDNDFDKGNIFKALVRIGKKADTSIAYDINKCHFFLDELEKAINYGKKTEKETN